MIETALIEIAKTQGLSTAACVALFYYNLRQTREIICMKNLMLTYLIKKGL